METEYKKSQAEKQRALLQDQQSHAELFDNAQGFGCWWDTKKKEWGKAEYILIHKDSVCNLYAPIRQEALNYFERNDIAWWQQDTDRYFPTGNLLSSQIHCLNHLMAIQRDKKAVRSIIKALCPKIKDILPSPIDSSVEIKNGKRHYFRSYITFEFTCANHQLLEESGEKRGKKCTSVDAFVYAVDQNDHPILIPIEWKYTEAYEKTEKYRAYQDSIDRYVKYANLDSSNLKKWIREYEWDPLYEFARQEILMERIIKEHPLCGLGYNKKPLTAEDYIHIIVRPDENKLIRKDIDDFRESIVDKSKFIEVAPQDLLAPLKGNDKYADLLNYLQKRYWQS